MTLKIKFNSKSFEPVVRAAKVDVSPTVFQHWIRSGAVEVDIKDARLLQVAEAFRFCSDIECVLQTSRSALARPETWKLISELTISKNGPNAIKVVTKDGKELKPKDTIMADNVPWNEHTEVEIHGVDLEGVIQYFWKRQKDKGQ